MKVKLKDKIKGLPEKPGVYLMKDARKRVIYVGKARNLKQRVSHYYHASGNFEPKTASLVGQIKDIDYIATDSEIDAMLLEASLIRDAKPKYNIQLKDDKTFPLLAITSDDDFPRIFFTRQRGQKNINYYGPFISATDLKSALKSLQRIFRFRTCTRQIHSGKMTKECLLYHINNCTAPCIGKISKDDYAEVIELFKDFVSGSKDNVLCKLSEKMKGASRNQDFEKAVLYRDQINALKGITNAGKMGSFYEGLLASITPEERLKDLQLLLGIENIPRKIEGVDISDIKGSEAVGALVTFIDGEPFKNGYRKYKIKFSKEGKADDYERMSEVVYRRLHDKENALPDILLVDGGRGHISVVESVFAKEKITPPIIVGLSKSGGDHLFTNTKYKRQSLMKHKAGFTLLQYIRDEAHRFAQKYHHLLRKKALKE